MVEWNDNQSWQHFTVHLLSARCWVFNSLCAPCTRSVAWEVSFTLAYINYTSSIPAGSLQQWCRLTHGDNMNEWMNEWMNRFTWGMSPEKHRNSPVGGCVCSHLQSDVSSLCYFTVTFDLWPFDPLTPNFDAFISDPSWVIDVSLVKINGGVSRDLDALPPFGGEKFLY